MKKKSKKKERETTTQNRTQEVQSDSFEDMIAYVDEFGVITDTPPEPKKEEKIELESIEISTPKMEVTEEDDLKGRVGHFNYNRGYGFIKDFSGRNEYFFHISNAPADISEGDRVAFELEQGDRGMNAVNVTIIE